MNLIPMKRFSPGDPPFTDCSMLAVDGALICDFTWRDFGVVTGQANSENT